jgi:hypothetical protein
MNVRIPLAAIVALGSVIVSRDGNACSPSHVATATEITDAADVILLVRVPEERIQEVSPIKMTVLQVIKGKFGAKTVVVQGQTARYEGPNDHPPPYDFVRPGGRSGDCFAADYKAGGQFLLLLRKGDVHWSPLAATNEEVSGAADPWVVWVKKRISQREKA